MDDITYFNPFPGLRAFEEDEEHLFFGREQQIDNLLEKLEHSHFLAVVGASGSGKSSLVKSGLLPSFHSGFIKGVGSGWRIGVFRPGDDPIGNLADCFCSEELIEENESENQFSVRPIVEAILRRSNGGIQQVVSQFLAQAPENILLVVDQFEELFRFSKYEKKSLKGERDSVAFINLLLDAVKDHGKRVYIMITMRSDFLGNCTEFRGLPEAINKGQYLIPRMTREEKKLAIKGPIAVGGASITPQLLTLLLNEVGDNPDHLPILQHSLMRTWDYWQKHSHPDEPIDVKHYLAIGKMEMALSVHADEAYNELKTERKKIICANLFKALTEIGTNQGGVRRPTRLKELEILLQVSREELVEVIDVFRAVGRSFLMPPISQELNDDTVIDISHESLMRVWKRLNTWVRIEAESAETYKSIALAAKLYQEGKAGLYKNPELQLALLWREKNNPNEDWAFRYDDSFIRAMTFLDESKVQYDFEIEQKEKDQKRRLRRTQIITVVLSLAFIVSLVFAVLAVLRTQEAEAAKILAIDAQEEAELNAEKASTEEKKAKNAESDAKKQAILASEAAQEAQRQEEIAKVAEGNALQSAEEAKIAEGKAKKAAIEANEQREEAVKAKAIAVAQTDTANNFRNQAEAKNLALMAIGDINQDEFDSANEKVVRAFDLNKKGQGPATVNIIYIAATRTLFERSQTYTNTLGNHSTALRAIVAIPNTSKAVSIDQKGTLILSEINEISGLALLSKREFKNEHPRSLGISLDGKILLVGTLEGTIFRINITDGSKLSVPIAFHNFGSLVQFISCFEMDKKPYALVTTDAGVKLLSLLPTSFDVLATIGLDTGIKNCNVNSKNKMIIGYKGKSILGYTYSINQKLELVCTKVNSTNTKAPVSALSINQNGIVGVGLENGSVDIITNISSSKPAIKHLHDHLSKISAVHVFNKNGSTYAASSSYDNSIMLMNVSKKDVHKEEKIIIEGDAGHKGWVLDLVPSSDGNYIFSAGNDKTVKFWFVETKNIIDELLKK